MFFLVAMVLLISASHIGQQKFDKITVREFELVDNDGQQRVSIRIEDSGEVVFRLRDSKGAIRVKLGAADDGSGLVLLDDSTNPGIHALSKNGRTTLTLASKDGKKREF